MVEHRGRIARQGTALVLVVTFVALLVAATRSARLERADFVFNNGNEVRTLDPSTVTGIAEGNVIRALFEGLTVQDPSTLEPRPGMASSWEVTADGKTYTFHLRPDACWIRPGTDSERFAERGDPVTAHDFVRSWERLLHPSTAAEYAYQLWCVRGARPYSLMPDDRYYGPVPAGPWIRIEDDGRARLGLHGSWLEETAAPDLPLAILVEPGDEVESHDPVLEIEHARLPARVAGRILAVNPDAPRTVGELAEDPFEGGWLLELEPAEGAIERALAEGAILAADVARRTVYWPHVGVRADDDHTLVVELARPTPYFLDLTAFYPLYPVHVKSLEEAKARWPDMWQVEWVRPANLVTNGPFRIVERRINDRIRLARNPVYWDVENVAMRTIDVLAVQHLVTSLNLYLTGEVDWISAVPTNLVPRLRERDDFAPSPHFGSYFYRVNVGRPPLDDVRVRRALALAIDRRAICEKILKAGQIPSWAFVPHGLADYPRSELEHGTPRPDLSDYDEVFAADCARARELLAEAGYGEGGASLPPIAIHYNTSETHRDIAEVVTDGWRRMLGIDAKLSNQEWKVYMDAQRSLDYDVSRSSWMGDFVDPVNFLNIFRTGSANNRTGWSDARYDALLDEAAAEVDEERRLELLSRAEAVLMAELPILPIYTYVTQNMVNPRLGGFGENVLDVHFLKFLYWRDRESEEGR